MANVYFSISKLMLYDYDNEFYIYDPNKWGIIANTAGDALVEFEKITGISFIKVPPDNEIKGDLLLVSKDERLNGYRVNLYIRRISSRFSFNFNMENDLGYILEDGDEMAVGQLF